MQNIISKIKKKILNYIAKRKEIKKEKNIIKEINDIYNHLHPKYNPYVILLNLENTYNNKDIYYYIINNPKIKNDITFSNFKDIENFIKSVESINIYLDKSKKIESRLYKFISNVIEECLDNIDFEKLKEEDIERMNRSYNFLYVENNNNVYRNILEKNKSFLNFYRNYDKNINILIRLTKKAYNKKGEYYNVLIDSISRLIIKISNFKGVSKRISGNDKDYYSISLRSIVIEDFKDISYLVIPKVLNTIKNENKHYIKNVCNFLREIDKYMFDKIIKKYDFCQNNNFKKAIVEIYLNEEEINGKFKK